MTRIDRLHIEATIAALDALSFLVGGGAAADCLRAHRVALRQALDADPAPAVVDPYPGCKLSKGFIAAYSEAMGDIGISSIPVKVHYDPQQYDADAPKDPK